MKITTRIKYQWGLYYIFGLFILFLVLISTSIWKKIEVKNTLLSVATGQIIIPMKGIDENDTFRWKNNSRYTLVIYTSLDCAHCRKLYTFIESRYEIFGDAFNLIYRNAPLTEIEPLSKWKAILWECLKKIEGGTQYFQYITELYAQYNLFQKDNEWAYTIAKKYTKKKRELLLCRDSTEMQKMIEQNQQDSLNDWVVTTPTLGIFFDGELVGRYAVSGSRAMQIVEYLSIFSSKSDLFWSEGLLEKYLEWYNPPEKK